MPRAAALVVDEEAPATVRSPGWSGWIAVLILLLAVMSAFFDRINVAVLFTNAPFKAAIGVGNNPALLGLLMTAFVFAYGLSAIFLSGFSDLFGPRRALSVITLILAVTMAVMGGSASYFGMLTGRIVLGLAEGPQFGTANLVVKRWFPAGKTGVATALWTIGSPLGSAVGFPFVIFLMAHYGWRASFYALAVLNGLIVLPAIWLLFRNAPASSTRALPVSSEMSFGAALRLLMKNGQFWLLAIYDSGAMIWLWGFSSWLPTYLRQARGFDLLHAGVFSSLPFIVMIGGQFFGAFIGDKWRCRAAICLVGLSMSGVSILAATHVANANAAALWLAASAAFWGMTVPTLFAMGSEIIPRGATSAGFGIYAGLANLVGAAAPFIMGILIGHSGNFSAGLLFIVLSCVLLSFAMIPLLRHH